MGALDRLRSNPRWAVAAAAAAVLLLAWIAWAIYVTSSNGATAGLGVVLAWPAMLVALALISLPFIGAYLLIRRLSEGEGATAEAAAPVADEDDGSEEEEEDDSDDEEKDSDEEDDSDAEEDEEDDSDAEEDEESEESDDDETEDAEAEKAGD